MSAPAAPTVIPAVSSRVTKEGRKLTYELTVIQQPERARACGSGAKSSADRRPVDPPPVVKLRIYEGDSENDITFAYNANFFLFATLESARQIVHGRMQPTPQQIPVLTGMPVSGMAYLDRPEEAGYFIFPDLSVRHEGRYKLTFNLYEETKEAKDGDVEQMQDSPKPPPVAATPNGCFDWRLEVKSKAFTVYSAKKFPGLAESTALSRTVAEQGCRVRIRRDVRMRRRDGKGGNEYDEYEDEFSRSRRTATPETSHETYIRHRSLSSSSIERQPYASEPRRRPSGVDYPQQPLSSNYAPSSAPPPSAPSGYLSFGNSSAAQYHPPQFAPPAPPSQPIHPQQPYQPPHSSYIQPPPPSYRNGPNTPSYPYQERQPHPNHCAPQRDNYDSDYRRPSAAYTGGPPSATHPYSNSADHKYNRSQPASSYPPYIRPHTPILPEHNHLAPLNIPAALEPTRTPSGPLTGSNRVAPPLPSPGYPDRPNSFNNYSAPTSAPVAADASRNGKRPYGSAFKETDQPLHNGMRPTSSHHVQDSATAMDEDDDSGSLEQLRMQYKRADGTSYSRDLPAL